MEKGLHCQYIRQPKFYNNFHCIGGSCNVHCCQHWQIDYEYSDVERLKNVDCSEHLKALIDNSFEPYKGKFRIKLNDRGECPFHNEEGLCSIQKELGEEYLSQTCIIYPRIGVDMHGYIVRSCYISCPYVFSLICADDNAMELENIASRIVKHTKVRVDSEIDWINHPELKYKSAIFDFFYEILSDKSHSVETSVVLGAMAAQKLEEFIKQGKYERIPDVIKALRSQLKNQAQIDKLEQFKSNLTLKANFSAGLLNFINKADIFKTVFENGVPSEEKFAKGTEIFEKNFNGSKNYMRNIVLNLYITNDMPFRDKKHSLYENYCWYVAEIAAVKFLIPAVSVKCSPVTEKVSEAVAIIDRSFSHNDQKGNDVLAYMKALKCTSPAYLLGIIK